MTGRDPISYQNVSRETFWYDWRGCVRNAGYRRCSKTRAVAQNICKFADLRTWLKPFVEKQGYKKRRQMCPLYVARLIGPGERKSIEPMVARMAT